MQPFQMFVLLGGATTPRCCNDVCKRSILLALHTATLPLVGKQFAYLNTFQALVDPIFGIAQATIVSHSLFDREFRVLHLVETLCCYLRHPLLKRFCFRRRYGLNDAEKLFSISHIGKAHLTVCSPKFQSVTICHGFISFSFQSLF